MTPSSHRVAVFTAEGEWERDMTWKDGRQAAVALASECGEAWLRGCRGDDGSLLSELLLVVKVEDGVLRESRSTISKVWERRSA